MKILITGALGFVGVYLVRKMAAQSKARSRSGCGSMIIAADLRQPDEKLGRFLAPVEKDIEIVRLDVTDRDAVHKLINEASITHIVHGAALTPTVEQEMAQPTHIVDVNLGGAINVLDAAAHSATVERLLTVSSSGIYGAPANPPFRSQPEEGPLSLANLYTVTKYSAELLTQRYSQLCGKPMASVRLGPIYAPIELPSASRPRISQPGQLLAALRDQREVKVAGPSVKCDWTHADDIAQAIWALLIAPRWRYSLYNVSNGVAVTFGDVVDEFVEHGLSATWVPQPNQADIAMLPSQERLPMDISRLERDSGFVAQYDLTKGLATCVEEVR